MVEEPGQEPQAGGEKTPEEELSMLRAQMLEIQQSLADKDSEIGTLNQTRQEMEKRLAAVDDGLSKAIASYKSVVAKANPEIIDGLITGDTIESIDDSLSRARELVSKVRRGVQNEISLVKVPAGAPERTSPDLAGLTSREKIQYAIGKK